MNRILAVCLVPVVLLLSDICVAQEPTMQLCYGRAYKRFVAAGQSNILYNSFATTDAAAETLVASDPVGFPTVVWIQEAQGGSAITVHLPGTERWNETIRLAAGQQPAAYMWVHGETDALTVAGGNAYYAGVKSLFSGLHTQWPGMPIISAELGVLDQVRFPGQTAVRAALKAACAEEQPCIEVPTLDLTKVSTVNAHYDLPSARRLGERLAVAYLTTLGVCHP